MSKKQHMHKLEKADLADSFETCGPMGYPLEVGKQYWIRGAVLYWIGVVVKTNHVCVLLKGGWLADTGRFSQMVATGKLNEFEPIPDVFGINVDMIQDFGAFPFDIPKEAV